MMKYAVLLACVAAAAAQNLPGKGFGDDYAWYDLKTGLAAAKEQNKPAIVVLHQSWCGACKRLGPLFAKDKNLLEESKEYIMINCLGDEGGCADKKWQVDGGYVPRIFFTKPSGEIVKSVKGPNAKYAYFYGSTADIVANMKEFTRDFKAGEGEL